VVDFTTTERPRICKSEFGVSDRDLAKEFGVNADLDFNGHGSWIGGTIGAATNGTGTNGLAPNVRLVSLKISQWCGSAYPDLPRRQALLRRRLGWPLRPGNPVR
jgi:hypothetical protein